MVPLKRLTVGALATNCYILFDEEEKISAIIDPGGNADQILRETGRDFLPTYIINTHGHFDHTDANAEVARELNLPVSIHKDDVTMLTATSLNSPFLSSEKANGTLNYEINEIGDGENLEFGAQPIKVIHTPGHTPGSVCLMWKGNLFSGDLLFRGSIGRTDLPGGSYRQMMKSLEIVDRLSGETQVFPGHNGQTTVAIEIKENPYLLEMRGSEDED